jgi:hypothetical protein
LRLVQFRTERVTNGPAFAAPGFTVGKHVAGETFVAAVAVATVTLGTFTAIVIGTATGDDDGQGEEQDAERQHRSNNRLEKTFHGNLLG